MSAHLLDSMAQQIFQAALAEDRCGELLEALFDGGTATVDARTGRLLIASAADIRNMKGTG